MSMARTLQRSFAGGEITPELFGRVDWPKYAQALAECKNFMILPHGPAVNRPGFEYIASTKYNAKKSRIIPFSFNAEQTYALEFGDQYVRFHTDGATLLERSRTITGITQANPAVVTCVDSIAVSGQDTAADTITLTEHHWPTETPVQSSATSGGLTAATTYYVRAIDGNTVSLHTSAADATADIGRVNITGTVTATITANTPVINNGDWVYISGIVGMTELNGRFFIVANKSGSTFQLTDLYGTVINSTAFGAYTSGGTIGRVYELTTPFVEADLMGLQWAQSADVLTLVHKNYPPSELRRSDAVDWALENISFNAAISPPTGVTATPTGAGATTYIYVVSAIAKENLEESLESAEASCVNDLTTAGNANLIQWTAVTGAVRYNIYRKKNGIYGYIGQAAGTAFWDDYITPDATKTPPDVVSLFNAGRKYPRTVCYFEQRRCFAGSKLQPQTMWLSRSGTETNFTRSIPTNDNDSITVRIVARELNAIEHLVPLSDLIVLSGGGEWRAFADGGGAITPASLAVRPNGYFGASSVRPAVTGGSVIYAQAQGKHLRELTYGTATDGTKQLNTIDISILAPHLFDDYSIMDMAYVRAPQQVLWVVRSDGKLLGLTYVPEQEILAWHQHETNGYVEAVGTIIENGVDAVYMVVRRTINGGTRRYIERMSTREFSALEDAFFVDCGLQYSGASATTLSGLHHLEGKSVTVLGDGAVFAPLTVSNGAITLPEAVSKASIGLSYTSSLQTLPWAIGADQSFLQGNKKNITRAWLRCYRSSDIWAGPSSDKLIEYKQRTSEPYGSPPAMINDAISIALSPLWSQSGQLVIKHYDPTPLDVLSLTLEVSVGG